MSSDGTTHFPDSVASSSSFVRWIVTGVALINLFVFGMVAFSLYQSFGEFEERAEVTAGNQAQMLAQDIGREFEKIDVTLLSAADEIDRQVASGGIDRSALNVFLGRLQRRIPEIINLSMTDVAGIATYGPGAEPNGRPNDSDREYFIRQRDNAKAGLVVARPEFILPDKKWVVPMSRSIHMPDGSFGGVVYVNVALEHVTNVFSTLDIGRRGSVSVRDAELRIFARYPIPKDVDKVIGGKLVIPELQELIQAGREAGTYITNRTVDGVERKFAVHRIPNYPLYAVVGRATEEYMAQWKNLAVKTLVLAALFCLTTLISSRLVYRDFTERKRAEQALRDSHDSLENKVKERTADLQTANTELLTEKARQEDLIRKLAEAHSQLLQAEKLASIGQLASGVAHEINNPIGFVNSNLGSLQRYMIELFKALSVYENSEGELTEKTRAVLNDLKKKIDLVYLREDVGNLLSESKDGLQRVSSIVQNLKDFSHIDASERQLANLQQGLDSTLNVVWNELKYKADVDKVYGNIAEIECVPSQLNQVFMNLLMNAGQAIEGHGKITIRTGQEGDNVWVEVEDTGKGIKPEHLGRIFDPFFTTKPVGSGTGLGLSLSYGIVQKHGGRIDVKSEVGKGSVFRVWLPVTQHKAVG